MPRDWKSPPELEAPSHLSDGREASSGAESSAFIEPTSPSPAELLSGATRMEAPPAQPGPAGLLSGPTAIDPASSLPARLGSYRVLGIIGAGGMGTVVRARHAEEGWAEQQGGDVAIKLIHPHIASEPDFRKRFFAEAALGRRLQHPGLATVYDVVTDGPWLGTILEYVEGDELTAWIRPGGLPVRDVVSLLVPLAEALDHLHAEGIVHRDLKPGNVKVRAGGRPVLLDLGIAKDLAATGAGHTKTMTTLGTSAWMAPEQADAKTVTAAADVYALGLVAYALLSGRLPWGDDTSELRVLTNKMMGKLEPLSRSVSGVPRHVSDAVMGALAVEPEQRPASCGQLVASLADDGLARREDDGLARREDDALARREDDGLARREAAQTKLNAEADALVAAAARVGARLKLPATVTARWVEKAGQKVKELKQARLQSAAEALAAEAESVGARLKLPSPVTARWLEKARSKVEPMVAARRQARAREQAEAKKPSPSPSEPARWVLLYEEGTAEEQAFPILGDILTIGRGRDNDVQIKSDAKVSRFHCRLSFRGDHPWIEDLKSSCGTLVNGALITERRLFGGEEVVVGETFFRFRPAP